MAKPKSGAVDSGRDDGEMREVEVLSTSHPTPSPHWSTGRATP